MKNATRLLEILDRSLIGTIVDEDQFNMEHVNAGIERVVEKFDVQVPDKWIVNQNDELADRVWQAAVDFLADCGVFCQSTGRVIQYDRDEILAIVAQAPSEILLGAGSDSCLEVARKVEDPRVPINMGSPIGAPISEALFVPAMQSYVQESLVDVTCGASMTTVHGRDIRTGSPLELLAAWNEVDKMMQVLRKVGRPGMAWTGVTLSVSDVGQLSAVGPEGLRSTDMHTFGMISELKTNFEILNKVAHSVRMGGIIDPYANPIYGGMGGGVAGQAVLITAAMVALSVVFMAAMVGSSPTHPFHFNDTGPEVMRASSLAFQALARNSHLMTNLTVTPVGGPGTKILLYECVAFTVMSTVSGVSRILGPRSATGSVEGHFSGLEARFNGEVLHAASKLDRSSAEEIVQKALSQYANDLDKKPYGRPFEDVYDLNTVQPKDDWLRIYEEVREEVSGWGLPLV